MLIDVFKVISIAYLKRSFTAFWALDGFGPTRSSSKQVHGFSCCKKEALLLDTAVADHHDVRICGLFFKLRNIFATSGQLNNPRLCECNSFGQVPVPFPSGKLNNKFWNLKYRSGLDDPIFCVLLPTWAIWFKTCLIM